MIRKVTNVIIRKFMESRGYSTFFAMKAAKEIYNDFFRFKNATIKKKIWAYRRGFLSKSIMQFGINEDNYSSYMPDLIYYKLHPINGKYSRWIDDKLTIKYILRPYNEYLPKYFFVLQNNEIIKMIDCPEKYEKSVQGVIELLKKEKEFAVKLIAGSLGQGFYKLSYNNVNFCINNTKVTEEKLRDFISNLDNYTITEYIHSHKNIRKIYDETANNLRIMLVNDYESGPQITGAFMKFGTKKSGMIEHVWAGGIFCKIDISNGSITTPYIYEGEKLINIQIHPDSKVKIEGTIPHWGLIKDKIIEMANYIPQLKYMGFDVLVTDNGFKIIEINSHQGLNLMQMYYPVMENEVNRRFFQELINKR